MDRQVSLGDEILDGVFGTITWIEGDTITLVSANYGRTITTYDYNDLEWSEKLDCWYPIK